MFSAHNGQHRILYTYGCLYAEEISISLTLIRAIVLSLDQSEAN
jgi:hypothetical protein